MKNTCDCSACQEMKEFDENYDEDDNSINIWCSVFVIGAIVIFFVVLIGLAIGCVIK
jgi:hypothetical protein